MAKKKSALNLFISRLSVKALLATCNWKQSSRTKLANFLAFFAWHAMARRRKICLKNLELCFPDWSQEKRVEVAKGVFRNLVRAALDHSVLWKGTKEQVLDMVKFDGLQDFLALLAKKPAIVICPHFVGLDAGGIALNNYYRGGSLYQVQSNPVWDKCAFDGRKRFADPILIPKSPTAMKQVIRLLRGGTAFYYLPDMDHGRQNSIFVPFFGVPAATLPMVSRLAKITGVPAVWAITETTPEGYITHLSKPLENFPTDDPQADTLRITQELEQFILKYPDNYLWTHRRFKTRPEGEPDVYSDL